jgi:hypothetical protein
LRRAVSLVLLCLLTTISRAAELRPYLESAQLGVTVRGLMFPETLPRDLKSGLTTHFLVRVSLSAKAQPVGTRVVELAIRYDLWDETFRLTVTADDKATSQKFSSLEQVTAFLAAMNLPNLFTAAQVPPQTPLIARAEVLLNPIERERMERLRKWVAENSAPASPAVPRGPDSAVRPSNFTSNTFFNRIFEEYSSGNATAAAWRAEVSSKAFSLEELPHVEH